MKNMDVQAYSSVEPLLDQSAMLSIIRDTGSTSHTSPAGDMPMLDGGDTPLAAYTSGGGGARQQTVTHVVTLTQHKVVAVRP